MGAVTAMAADDECHGPGITGRVGGHLSVATSAGRGRWPGGFSVELAPLTGGGLQASRTWHAMPFEAIHPLPAFGVVFRPFDSWIRSPVVLERESNPRQTTYEVVALPD